MQLDPRVGLGDLFEEAQELPITVPLDDPIAPDTTTRVSVSARGSTITVERDGEPVGTVDDKTFTQGRVVLGIFPDGAGHEPPFRVAFTDVEIRRL